MLTADGGCGNVDTERLWGYSAIVRTVYVAEYPAIQHRHDNNDVVTVRLRRKDGVLRATCAGCDTEFVYRKPQPSGVQHFKSPLLPGVKGNFDSPDDDH